MGYGDDGVIVEPGLDDAVYCFLGLVVEAVQSVVKYYSG
jgi:hypothetical protein